MFRAQYIGYGTRLKGIRRLPATIVQPANTYHGLALEISVGLGLLAIALSIRIVGTMVL